MRVDVSDFRPVKASPPPGNFPSGTAMTPATSLLPPEPVKKSRAGWIGGLVAAYLLGGATMWLAQQSDTPPEAPRAAAVRNIVPLNPPPTPAPEVLLPAQPATPTPAATTPASTPVAPPAATPAPAAPPAPAAKTTTVKPAAGAPTYTLQLGSFRDKANAASLVERMTKRGETARAAVELGEAGQVWHKVQVGAYPTQEAAKAAAAKLKSATGLEGIVVRMPPPT